MAKAGDFVKDRGKAISLQAGLTSRMFVVREIL